MESGAPSQEELRRAPYGDNQQLGPRGQRARRHVLTCAVEVFREVGYANATMDAIAERTGKSRASVYQYFASKSEIYAVLTRELGRELLLTCKRMNSLGPDRAGFEHLKRWISEYFEVCRAYNDVFLIWGSAEITEGTFHGPASAFLDRFAELVVPRLNAAGAQVRDPRTLALAMAAMFERCSFLFQTRELGFDDDELADAVARSLQLTLFPGSIRLFRSSSVVSLRLSPEHPSMTALQSRAVLDAARASIVALTPRPSRPVSPQGAVTVRAILDAAAQVFARKGFHGTSVDDVMSEAGLSHGAMYQYWSDLGDVLHALAAESFDASWEIFEQLDLFNAEVASADLVSDFLERYLANYERNSAVFRVWTSLTMMDPLLDQLGDHSVSALMTTVSRLLERASLADVLRIDAATVVLIAVVTHLPYPRLVCENWGTHDQLREAMTLMVCRGFLGVACVSEPVEVEF
jgi:AcrR family transcriptional regulator